MLDFAERLSQPEPIRLDGATGTELEKRGLDSNSPIWSARALIENPELVQQVHLEYLLAGAEVITANTFRTQQRALEKEGLGRQALALTRQAVQLARNAITQSDHIAFIAGSIAPLEDCYSPELVPDQEDLILEHTLIAENLALAGADLLLVETMNTIREAHAAAQAARQTGLPFGVSFVCNPQGQLLSGESIADAVNAIQPLQPNFLALNCFPASHMETALPILKASTSLPIGAYANIGHTDDFTTWNHDEIDSQQDFARDCNHFLSMGLSLIGGCCGTSPEHIAAISIPNESAN